MIDDRSQVRQRLVSIKRSNKGCMKKTCNGWLKKMNRYQKKRMNLSFPLTPSPETETLFSPHDVKSQLSPVAFGDRVNHHSSHGPRSY